MHPHNPLQRTNVQGAVTLVQHSSVVQICLNKESLQVVKLAAHLIGVPYQTFMKQVVYEHARQELKDSSLINESSDAA